MNEEKDKSQRKAESEVHQLEEKNKVCASICVCCGGGGQADRCVLVCTYVCACMFVWCFSW